jgi:hypothetical protein
MYAHIAGWDQGPCTELKPFIEYQLYRCYGSKSHFTIFREFDLIELDQVHQFVNRRLEVLE